MKPIGSPGKTRPTLVFHGELPAAVPPLVDPGAVAVSPDGLEVWVVGLGDPRLVVYTSDGGRRRLSSSKNR